MRQSPIVPNDPRQNDTARFLNPLWPPRSEGPLAEVFENREVAKDMGHPLSVGPKRGLLLSLAGSRPTSLRQQFENFLRGTIQVDLPVSDGVHFDPIFLKYTEEPSRFECIQLFDPC